MARPTIPSQPTTPERPSPTSFFNNTYSADVSKSINNWNRKSSVDPQPVLKLFDGLKFAFIGLPSCGKTQLISTLSDSPTNEIDRTKHALSPDKRACFYELGHPGGGFLQGSINENEPRYREYFKKHQLSQFNHIFIVCTETVREEDLLFVKLANEENVPMSIIKTKFDKTLICALTGIEGADKSNIAEEKKKDEKTLMDRECSEGEAALGFQKKIPKYLISDKCLRQSLNRNMKKLISDFDFADEKALISVIEDFGVKLNVCENQEDEHEVNKQTYVYVEIDENSEIHSERISNRPEHNGLNLSTQPINNKN